MGQRWTFTLSICLCFLFSAVHNPIFVISVRGGVMMHPEFMPENDSQIPTYRPYDADAPVMVEGVSPGGKVQPFLGADQDGHDIASLQPLLVRMATAMNDLSQEVSSEGSDVQPSTIRVSSSTAELGCSIYSAYQTLCKPAVTTTSTSVFTFRDKPYTTTISPEDLFASCACYSSTYWVPDLYDNAAWACNQATPTHAGFTPSVTTIGGTPTGFCNYNNPRLAKFAYGLSTSATSTSAAATSTPAVTAKPTTTPASPSSKTQNGNATAVMGLCGEQRAWALAAAIAMVFVLL